MFQDLTEGRRFQEYSARRQILAVPLLASKPEYPQKMIRPVAFNIFTVMMRLCHVGRNCQVCLCRLAPRWFIVAISVARYPGWWLGVSSRSTSHSTTYRRP